MKKVSLNSAHAQYDVFKSGLYFRSSDGTITGKYGLLHLVSDGKPVFTNDAGAIVNESNLNQYSREKNIHRYIIEDVDEKKKNKAEVI